MLCSFSNAVRPAPGFSKPTKNYFQKIKSQQIISHEFCCGMKHTPPLNFPYPVFSTNPVSIQSCDGQLNLCHSQRHQLNSVDISSYHVLTPVDVAYATVYCYRTLYTPYYVYSA